MNNKTTYFVSECLSQPKNIEPGGTFVLVCTTTNQKQEHSYHGWFAIREGGLWNIGFQIEKLGMKSISLIRHFQFEVIDMVTTSSNSCNHVVRLESGDRISVRNASTEDMDMENEEPPQFYGYKIAD